MNIRPALLSLLTGVVLAGCSALPAIGPDYKGVKLDLPQTYREAAALHLVSDTVPYWQRLNDPILNSLEQQALEQSLTLKQAWQRVKQARSASGIALGALGPQVQAQGGYQGQRIGAQANLINGTTQTLDIFSAGLGASWELDFFGGNRRAAQGAAARAEAAQASADAVRSLVLAEVARQYITYRSLQAQSAVVAQQVEATARLAQLVTEQARVGLADGPALAQANARAQTAAMQLPPLRASVLATQYQLESLLGQKPGSLDAVLAASSTTLPALPASATLVLPSQLVLLRPDLRAQERTAAAATAEVGVAMADLFPRFSLTGSYGVQGPELGKLGEPTALVWSGGPEFRWTLFAMGRVWQNIKMQQSKQREAVLAYQQAALDALADVESRLAAYRAAGQSLSAAQALESQTTKLATAAQNQHTKGLINGAELQQSLAGALEGNRARIQAQQQALQAYVTLHQALGF